MALLCCCDSYLAVAASSNVFVVSQKLDGNGAASASGQSWPVILSAVVDDASSSTQPLRGDDFTNGHSNEADGKWDMNSESASCQILAVGSSFSGRLLAVCNNRKQLIVWKLVHGEWTRDKYWFLEKQATALSFSGASEESVLVADRSGQVTEYSLVASEAGGKVILGHLSILLDLCLSKSERYLITADRDEKIRVSHYPRAYDIQSFCLGHTEYVRTLCLCPGLHEADEKEGILASGGGDGLLKLWRFVDGLQLASFDVGQTASESEASANDGQQPEWKRIRKILCIPQTRNSEIEMGTFRLALLFEGTASLRFLDVTHTSNDGYVIADTAEWTPDQFSRSGIGDVACVDGRLYVLISGESDFALSEIDALSTTPVQSPSSAELDLLIRCKELKESVIKAKEELPPMEKVVQFDNVSEYLERKKARIESWSKVDT